MLQSSRSAAHVSQHELDAQIARIAERERMRNAVHVASANGRQLGEREGWSRGAKFGIVAGFVAGALIAIVCGWLVYATLRALGVSA